MPSAAVVGAGLAGAAVAFQLAQRGWDVEVFEQGPRSASGASGLPVGLFCPTPSVDDNFQSQFIRAGLELAISDFKRHLRPALDWALTGVLEGNNSTKRLQAVRAQMDAPYSLSTYSRASAGFAGFIEHLLAGWVKPSALVAAWLHHPRIRLHTQHTIASQQDAWALAQQHTALVLCAGHASAALCPPFVAARLPLMRPIRGQITLGQMQDWQGAFPAPNMPAMPINGHGHILGHIPSEAPGTSAFWAMGATFDRDDSCNDIRQLDHQRNLEKLAGLLPSIARFATPIIESNRHWGWAGVRCYIPDRLPLVGRLGAGLYIVAGLGSRGLSTAGLCARLLADQMDLEHRPISGHTRATKYPFAPQFIHDLYTKINVTRYLH